MAFKLCSATNRLTAGLLVTLAVSLLNKQWTIEACFVGPLMDFGQGLHRHLAVASEDVLEFMTSEGQVTSVTNPEFNSLSAVTYDPARGQMYLTDNGHDNASIFQFDVNTMKKTPLIPKQNESLHGIAYDPVSASLFWTTCHGQTIEMMSLDSGISRTLHKFSTEVPMGIAVDNCRRLIYWTNSNHRSPSIERSSLNGSNREVFIKDDLFQPLGIVVDQTTNKLFWSDDRDGIFYKIESINLDGSGRKTLIHSTHQQPFSLTVGPEFIYWSDWIYNAVWSLPKKGHNHQPKIIKRYRSETPMGLVAQISTECHKYVPDMSAEDSSNALTKNLTVTSQEVEQKIPGAASTCLNNGVLKENGRTCDCPSGYEGESCEIPVCFNYCLHGSCYLGPAGFAQCKCQLGYEGDRCHKDVCEGYCLNSGRCNVARGGEPVCKCSREFKGQRCEKSKDLPKLGQYVITEEIEVAENSTAHMLVANEPIRRNYCENSVLGINNVILIGLGSVIAIQLVIMLVLVRKVCMLRKRPRIKKHIIVKKNITPLTSRPPQQGEQCEITIENCCNMNICETPCFEPQLRTSKTLSKTEEKTNLLGSMEESPSCSPCQEDLY